MDNDFEKGKQLFIEGLDEFFKMYEPAVKLARGVKLLGIKSIFKESLEIADSMDEWEMIQFVVSSLVGDVSRARNKEEVQEAVDKNRDFFNRLF